MKPIQKVLVPVDFSRHSGSALVFAADIGRRYEAAITLLHVWEPELYSVPGSFQLYDPAQHPGLLDEVTRKLEGPRHDLLAAGVMHVETALVRGSASDEIVRYAKDGAFDLIVMGTHGRTGLSHVLLGSVAERVVRSAPCSVLTTRLGPGESKQVPERAQADA